MSVVHTEHVLVVPTSEFQRVGYFQGNLHRRGPLSQSAPDS